MLSHHAALVVSILAAPLACTVAPNERADATPTPSPARSEVANPMASFSRMVGGEWRVTAARGTSTFDVWHWGPGQHSVRVMTDGANSEVVPEPWRELQVFYWHPGLGEIRMLGLSPFARGVSDGAIRFDGDTAEGVFDLYQTYGRRRMGLRWTFDGPDKYRDVLLEETGPAGLEPMNEWEHFRSRGASASRWPVAEATPKRSELPALFDSLVGATWTPRGQAKGDAAGARALQLETTFEWIPYADGIYARTVARNEGSAPTHLFDTYFFHHTGKNALRCLALSSLGGVYEGDVTVVEGGALQLDLTGYEGDEVVSRAVRLDFENDGSVRNRVWSLAGRERALLLDAHHEKRESKH